MSDGNDREQQLPELVEWDEEVSVLVTFRIKAKTNPDYFEGLEGRTPEHLAQSAAWRGELADRFEQSSKRDGRWQFAVKS